MYDSIIVGSGIAGSTAARRLAEEGKRNVLVIEKRSHIGGNCYDCMDEHGIWIHQYGPHIFHTEMKEVYEFVSRFTMWTSFRHEVVAQVGEQLIPVPFNLNTLHMVFEKDKAEELEKKLTDTYGYGSKVPIMELRKSEDAGIREICCLLRGFRGGLGLFRKRRATSRRRFGLFRARLCFPCRLRAANGVDACCTCRFCAGSCFFGLFGYRLCG